MHILPFFPYVCESHFLKCILEVCVTQVEKFEYSTWTTCQVPNMFLDIPLLQQNTNLKKNRKLREKKKWILPMVLIPTDTDLLCDYASMVFFPISFKKTDFTKEMHSRQTPGRHIAHIFLRFWIQIKNCNLIRFLCRIFRHIYWIFKIWISTNWFIWIWYVCELCISWNMNRMMAPIQFQKGKKSISKDFP